MKQRFKFYNKNLRYHFRRSLGPAGKRIRRRTLFNTQVRHLYKWLIKTYGIPTSVWNPSFRYMCFIEHMNLNKGLQTTIDRIKHDRLSVTRFLSGSPLSGPGLTYDGLPKKLGGLLPLIRSRDPDCIRFLLTVLNGLRRFNLPLQPKLETVTSPFSGGYYEWIFKYIPGFIKEVTRRLPRKHRNGRLLKFPHWEGFHLTTKGSPSGGHALVDCLQDLVNIPESLINSIMTFGGSSLSEKMELCRRHLVPLQGYFGNRTDGRKTFRSITAIPDSEGKTRLIAIGDYWSQTCLKPFHDYLNIVLRSIPQDQTFNQGEGLKELPFDQTRTYYSFDLSAFTDRFPSKILLSVLTVNFGLDKALAWYDIVNGYDFEFKDPKGLLNHIRYGVGNPMGFYTSWPLTTLCHHFIVYVACRESGISWSRAKYKLLGDDIVIFDDILASKYKELITLIGVEISELKTHTGNSLFEFAKRIFIPEGEVSPFSTGAGLSESKSYIGFLELLNLQYQKGWIPCTQLHDAVLDYRFSGPNAIRSRSKRKVVWKHVNSLYLYKRLKGYDDDLIFIRNIQSLFDYPLLSCNMRNKAKAFFSNCIVQCFEEAASSFYGDVEARLEKALIDSTSKDGDELVDAVYAHPYAYVYGKYVEESYLSQMKRAYDFDTLYGGEWLPYFRTIKATDATHMFQKRNYVSSVSPSSALLRKVHQMVIHLANSEYLS